MRLPDAFEKAAPEPLKERIPDGLWKVLEYGLLLGMLLVLVVGGVL